MDRKDCRAAAQAVRNDLGSAEFIVNDEKSVWEPTQVLNWLGITWNSILGTLKIVDRRVTKILNTIDHIINKTFLVSARSLASFTGQIISTGPLVGNIGRIVTRHCVMSTLCSDRLDTEFHLDDYCQEELCFGNQILSILTLDIVLHIHVLVHLCILMPALLVVVLLLDSIRSTYAIECGRILRAYRAPPGETFVRLNFLCNLLLLSLKDRMSNGLLIIARIVGSMTL